MSTFDPQMEPPGDWQTPYAPPTEPPTNLAGGRAAVYLWISAGLQVVISGCCGLMGIGAMFVSPAQFMENIPADMPNRDEIPQVLSVMGPVMIIASVLFLFLPALLLCILGFWVRSGGRPATIASLIILGIQSAALGLITLNYVAALFIMQSPAILLLIVFLVAILVLFIKTGIELIGVLRQQSPAYPSEAGW